MEDGSKQEKSTGSTLSTSPANASASAQVKSTGEKKASPVYPNAPTKDASCNSTGAVSHGQLLAILVMMGDFRALREEIPGSWQASSNGKIYWCVDLPGHDLSVDDGILLVDGKPVDIVEGLP